MVSGASFKSSLVQYDVLQSVTGTCQGCPLSPLLFVLALESLAIAIRSHPEIKGISLSGHEHLIVFFTDAILSYILDLKNTIPFLIYMIDQFGTCSGYKVSQSKSKIHFLNEQERIHYFNVSKD